MEEILGVINEADLWKVQGMTKFWSMYELYLFWTYIKHTILLKVDLISRKMWALERIGQQTACPLRCKHAAVAKLLHPTLCLPMDCSMPGFPVHHYLPEFSLFLCPLSQWYYFILCHSLLLLPSVCPSIRVFSNESALLVPGSQSIGASASVSVLPMNIQAWFPLELTVLISLLSKGLSRVFSSTAIQKHQFF